MASRSRLNKNKANTKLTGPPKIIADNPISTDDTNSKFQIELLWCIQQLESLLAENKLNPVRTKESIKALNILKNNSQPIIKKRQIMNLTFGDYRSKMAEEEKKLSKVNHQIKFKNKPNKSSVFIKKSALLSGSNDFKFNFDIKEEDVKNEQVVDEIQEVKQEDKNASTETNNFKFIPSENSFRFNFEINDTIKA